MASIERFALLRDRILRRDRLLREAKEAEIYLERTREIAQLREALAGSVAQIKVLRRHRIEVAQPRDSSASLGALENYRRKVAESAADSGKEHGIAKRTLDTIRNSVKSAADGSLKAVIHQIPMIEEVFLKQVEANPLYAQQVREIRSARDALKKEVSNGVATADELDSFLRKREELRALAEKLNPADFPDEVLEFFKAARNGAPLEKLTDGVRKWLSERGQLKNVRLFVIGQ